MLNILILSCGANACFHFAKIIKNSFLQQFRIIGTDINEKHLVPCSVLLDKFYKVPLSKANDYYETILDICKKENINVILPLFDYDLCLFNCDNEDLKKLNIKSISISANTSKLYENKSKMFEFLKDKQYPLPIIYNLNQVESEKEYFIKPIHGSGSMGAQKIIGKSIKEIKNIHEMLIQECCSNPEYTVECFYYKNNLRTITRERIAAKAGVCTKTKIFYSAELHHLAEKFTQIIECPVFFNLQFMKNSNHDFVVTDVNLRLAGGMSLSHSAGWDEVSAMAKLLLDYKESEIFSTLPKYVSPQYVVRVFQDIITQKRKNIVAYDLDGTLLDSRKRHSIVLNDILKSRGIELDLTNLIEFKRNGLNNVDFLISKGISSKEAQDIQKEWIKLIENEKYLNTDILYNFSIDLLKQDKNEYDLILITARNNTVTLNKQIDNLGLREYFKKVYIVSPEKNVSEQKSRILKQENAILMNGDTLSDKKAADMANIDFKHYDCGFNSAQYVFQR